MQNTWNYTCCVVGCKNNGKTSDCKFYKFPKAQHAVLQKRKWIAAVRRQNSDGSQWTPKSHDVICNHHFVDKKKSNDPLNPSYAPTLFPFVYHAPRVNEKAVLDRYNRVMNRRKSVGHSSIKLTDWNITENELFQPPENDSNNESVSMDENVEEISTRDQECQTNFLSFSNEPVYTFNCNRYIYATNQCDAEIQTELPEDPGLMTIKNRKKMKDKGIQYGPSIADFANKSVGCSEPVFEKTPKSRSFCGFSSIKTNEELLDIAGVNMANFKFLLTKTNKRPHGSTITKEQRLLIFLVKMKTGLTFSAIGIFFSLHRTTVSKIFFSTLDYLSASTANLVFWPSRAAIKKTMPACFKPDYSSTRVVMDCTEFKIDVPSNLDDRIFCYSHYKKGFTAKLLVVITPNGFICFKSKVAGGRKSDPQITIESNLIDLLEDGDVVLADKGFPEIRSVIDASGKKVFLIMPPFLEQNSEFTQEETNLTYSIAKVRIHVERIMQRLRIYQILYKIPEHLFSSLDKIIHVACVLVNLQPPIFSDKQCLVE